MTQILKGIVITAVAIPVSIIGMNVVGRLIEKHSKK